VTLVRFFLTRPNPGGVNAAASGEVSFSPTRSRVVAGDVSELVLPAPFTVKAGVDGRLDVDLAATSVEWAWRVYVQINGVPRFTEYVTVPDVEAVDFTDLVRVDPATLEPSADPEAAWWAALDQAQLGVHAIVDPDDPEVLILHYPSWQADPTDNFVLIMPIQEA